MFRRKCQIMSYLFNIPAGKKNFFGILRGDRYWSFYYSIFANTKTRRATAHTAASDLQRNAFKWF